MDDINDVSHDVFSYYLDDMVGSAMTFRIFINALELYKLFHLFLK